jgi:penicillin-binding protein 1A
VADESANESAQPSATDRAPSDAAEPSGATEPSGAAEPAAPAPEATPAATPRGPTSAPEDDGPRLGDDPIDDLLGDIGIIDRTRDFRRGGPVRRVVRFGVWLGVRLALVGLVLGGIAGVIVWRWLDRNILTGLPSDLSEYRRFRPPSSSLVYAADGTLVDEFYLERRVWVPLSDLPNHVYRAFISAEDRTFFEHPGFDLTGIFRAAVANYRSSAVKQGGSTITQQLVKNLLVGKEKSYERKLKELILAYRLDRELSKEEILELYLNYVFLGSGNYGIEAAARDYYGVSARELDPGQAALLAGLVPAPSRYSPRTQPQAAEWRRAVVLRAMVEERVITEADAERYQQAPVLGVKDQKETSGIAVAYVTQVRRELRRLLGNERAQEQGFRVMTPLDLGLQATADRAVKSALAALETRQGRAGPVRRLDFDAWDEFFRRAPGLRRDPRTNQLLEARPGDCFEALVPTQGALGELQAGPWRFKLQAAEWTSKVRGVRPTIVGATRTSTDAELPETVTATAPPAVLEALVEAGDVLRVCAREGGEVALDPRPWAEGAAIVLEVATGRMLALVGGYDVGLEGFVRATQAARQPGSSFKPYVYATALLAGRTQLDAIVDGPIALPAGGGKVWRPKNYDGRFFGRVTLREALTRSLNTVAVRLGLEVGPQEIARTARRLGVRTRLRSDITIALGSSEVTLLDQVLGYASLARMGVDVEPVFVDRLVDVAGNTVGAAGGDVVLGADAVATLPGGAGDRVLPAGVAYELVDMLRQVVRAGTARRAYVPELDRAGKTGTTNDNVDAWFIGFTPRYVVGVWIGTDGTLSLGDQETGGKAALPAWIEIVNALPHVPGERFPIPDEAALVRFGDQWAGLPRAALAGELRGVGAVGPGPLPAFDTLAPEVRR